jgi:hypothetical protein
VLDHNPATLRHQQRRAREGACANMLIDQR